MSESFAAIEAVESGQSRAEPLPLANAGPLRLAWRALLLDERAYTALANRTKPFQQGLLVLLVVLGIVLLARLIGLGLNWLTSPRLERIEALLQEFITGLPWYAEQVRQTPTFARQFAQSYFLSWEGLRGLLGIQTPASTGLWAGMTVLDAFLAWLIYGTLAHWLARWLGGVGRWSQTVGVLALAYAPLLLLVIELVPGAVLPLSLLFFALLIGKYQALKCVHLLSPGYALAAVLLPYLAALLLLLAALFFGAAYGLEQIPYFDQTIQTVRSAFGLWGMR